MKTKFNFAHIAMKAGGVAAGVVVGKVADKPLENMAAGLRGGLKLVVGAVLPELIPHKGKGVNFADAIGSGLMAVGAADLYTVITDKSKSEAPIEGADQFDEETFVETDDDDISGAEEEVLAGAENEGTLSGIGDED